MSVTYSTRAALQTPALNDRRWDVQIAANNAILEGCNAVGAGMVTTAEQPASASLNVAVAAMTFVNQANAYATYAGGTLGVSPSSTTFVWLTDSGVLASGAGWPTAGTKHVRLAIVASGASTITGITDARVASMSAG